MKIAVISPSVKNLETIGNLLREHSPTGSVTSVEGGMSKLRVVADQQRPDLMIVEGMCCDLTELGPLEYVTTHYPQITVVMLCTNETSEFLMNAMRAGVREVLPSPVTKESLVAAVARVELKMGIGTKRREPGQILAFVPCKGGSGATFVATNLGFQLAAANKRVLLIDLNRQFGDAVLFVHDHRPTTNLADVARNIHRLDASFLAASLVQITPTYGILAGPEDPAQSMEVKPEHIDVLLNLAASHYDFVILDMGRQLDAVTIKALDRAQKIFPVLQTMLPFMRDANRLLAVFRSLGYPPAKIGLVINRFEKGGDIGLADVERSLGVSDLRTIPNSYDAVAASVNQGRPIAMIARNNPVTKALSSFAETLLPKAEDSGGWLGRLMRRA
ncbi:MAG: AAA family ATPase [Burkholderiales bacterium]